MKSESERVESQLPCPQCRELTPADSQYCSSCGAEIYPQCPDCGTPRGADDAFCRKCGFNFTRKKLRLRQETPAADTAPEPVPTVPLPRAAFREPEKRSVYRLTPLGTAFRIMVTLLFLVLMAAAGFWVVNWTLGHVRGKDIVEKMKRIQSGISGPASVPEKPIEPDWKARYDYWLGYYRDAFSPVPTNIWVELCTAAGIRERGILVQVSSNTVLLRKDAQDLGFPKALLDAKTRQAFFPDDYADAHARANVENEKTEWKKQAEQQGAVSGITPVQPGVPAAKTFLDIKCPACSGQGFYMISAAEVKLGAKESGSLMKNVKEPCPVCGGRGYRRFEQAPDFPWPVGASRCSQCQGMGMLWSRTEQGTKKSVITTSVCPWCSHKGYVVNKWDADHHVPPRYE